MGFECRIEADSVSPDGIRLTTFVVTFPRFILAEVNTHRMLSRNSASSRAIPVEKRIAQIEADPFIPEQFGSAKKGMQAGEALSGEHADLARRWWMEAAAEAILCAKELANQGVHKQLANRLLEPFAWHTAIISATDWNNFFALRCHPDAQPEFRKIAEMMRDAMAVSVPKPLAWGQWHLPFVSNDDWRYHLDDLKLISAGRCCRVSYETHDGKRDIEADIDLAKRLIGSRPAHASPFEHQATPYLPGDLVRGNFRGWVQFRHEIRGESVPG